MIIGSIQKLWKHFLNDTLFRNSVYLIMTTGIMGLLGFFFWIICTRLFTPDEIGLGTTLVSAMTLISFISLFGFNSSFIRFLPSSQKKDEDINTGLVLVTLAAIVISALYIFFIPYITPKLEIIQHNIWYSIGFVVMVVLASVNSLTDSIFISFRSAQYNFLTTGVVTSITKLILPWFFVGLGAYGIFAASGLALSLGMVASIAFLIINFKFRLKFKISKESLRKFFHYSFTNYLANLINIIPTLVLPIIIINNLGAAAAGYYYLAFMIINLLYTVSSSTSQSLFAEGSYSENALRSLIKRSVSMLVIIMIPAAIILAVFGPMVLNIFGKTYSAGGSAVIVILSISAPAVAAYSLGSVLLRIRHQMYSLIATNTIYTLVIVGLAFYWVDKGLPWIAIAWTVGNFIAALFAFISLFIYRGKPTPSTLITEAVSPL